jgi:hypothetical protein
MGVVQPPLDWLKIFVFEVLALGGGQTTPLGLAGLRVAKPLPRTKKMATPVLFLFIFFLDLKN